MSSNENTALALRFYDEVWNKGNVDVADEIFAHDYVRHDSRPTQPIPGPEGQKRIASAFRTAFPDLHFDVEIVIAEGEFVVVRWTASGTHLGPWAPSSRPRAERPSPESTSSGSRTARCGRSGTIETTSDSWSRSERRSSPVRS
jgi:predicted ester cyclase